ncbi:MAG: hypothetical protein FJZ01_26515 [Candidatus Sericytochromatia bacterium]|nr:hypothetical protein [Candidatus Tanganyikabacteria bacterium]
MTTEWAVHAADAADLQDLLDGGLLAPAADRGVALGLPAPLPRSVVVTRLYWGDAFCHLLLPTRAERRQAEDSARRFGLDLTLATPPLAEPELAALREVLSWLAPGEEVEVNDWGVLRLLARDYAHLRPVLGRGLLKALKDPRREGGDRQPAVSDFLTSLLRRFGVGLVTADSLADPGPFGLAVAFPFQFVSSGRVCLIGSTSLETPQRFSLAAPCRRECREFMLDLRTPEWALVQKGNTVFAPWRGAQLEAFAAAVTAGRISRAIYAAGVDRDRAFLRGSAARQPEMIGLPVL